MFNPRTTPRTVRAPAGPRLARLLAPALPLLLGAPAALAQTNAGLLLEPFPKELAVDAEANAIFLEQGHVQETDEDFQLSIHQSNGRFRLDPGNLISPRVGYDFVYLDLDSDDDVGAGSFTGTVLPERLVDQSVAIGFPIGKIDDWIFATSLGVGYAGDGLGGDGDAWYGLASLVVFRQLNDNEAIFLALDYDGNRTFLPDVPLPGGGYLRRIGDDLQLLLGLPLSSVEWKPNDQLRLELSFLIPDDFRVDVGYEFVDGVTAFGRVRQQVEAFYLDGLPENHDRILFEQRRAEAGVRWEPVDQFSLDVALGYAFGTEFSEGFDSRETDEIADTSDEPYVRAGLQVEF